MLEGILEALRIDTTCLWTMGALSALHLGLQFGVFRTWQPLPMMASDRLSFEITSGAMCAVLAVYGTYHWVTDPGPEDRMYGYLASAHTLSAMIYGYEFYDTIVCILIKSLRKAEFIGHHVVTGLLAYCALAPFGHAYAHYFFGVVEISSALLTFVPFVDMGAFGRNRTLGKVLQYSFVAAFLVVRITMWPYISYIFWKDCLAHVINGTAKSNAVIYLFLGANVALTTLQFMWLSIIVKTALGQGDSEDKSKEIKGDKASSEEKKAQ
jgi:hypothetical protein